MADNFATAGVYLIQTFFGLYLILVMLRFLMQIARADYYNPLCQAIVKITDPPIVPLKRMMPTVRGVDFATLTVALIVQLITIMLVMMLQGYPVFSPVYIPWTLLGIFGLIFDIYFFALIIMVIASWIAPFSTHPALILVRQITEPVCAPARALLPPMGGIDFSIILVFVAITIIDNILVVRPLAQMLGVPRGLILGI
ncbi:MAG: YggT family protein [Pseudomonadales bacterium]